MIMMRAALFPPLVVCLLVGALTHSTRAQPAGPGGPCAQIRAACQEAGFVAHGAKTGLGIDKDCILPIMQGTPQPRRAAQPLPAIDPQIVTACKAKNPNFGMAHKGPSSMQPGAPPPVETPDEGPPPPAQSQEPPK
jgi:hypothetical protein